ncbi:MAG: hypothetical protein C4532_05160 [Candidatus Abyssobacteria bacterium SURF_17]|uniref:Uncharacterized protein n=1 Tax=Candidatus Abyssobacteria bacterium SURF_17 TaxID=2093361 RepID=A0A419F365_9BACT|nr:MAG: hypothetical protein C4532_05160 [Candidatus Abyssubacteria bacterium SURF_17]
MTDGREKSNLDLECVRVAGKLKYEKDIKELERTITELLGVLQQEGIFAFYLKLLEEEKDSDRGKDLYLLRSNPPFHFMLTADKKAKMSTEIPESDMRKLEIKKDILRSIEDIVAGFNLEQIILAKHLLERTLVYIRYKAKALKPRGEQAVGEQDQTS